MFSKEQQAVLQSAKIRDLFHTHCVQGDAKELTIAGGVISAEDLATHYGVKLSKTQKSNKYKGIEDADMGKTDTGGNLTASGAGDSKEQE